MTRDCPLPVRRLIATPFCWLRGHRCDGGQAGSRHPFLVIWNKDVCTRCFRVFPH